MSSLKCFQLIRNSVLLGLVFASFCWASTVDAQQGDLNAQIDRYIKGLRSNGSLRGDERTAWFVYDFTTGKTLASINAGVQLQAASMIKPYLALAFFHLVQEGKLTYGATSKNHMELMIQKSNNDSTNWVMRQIGGPAAAEAILKRHYPSVSQQVRIVEYIPQGGSTYGNKASAGDYAMFLDALWKGQFPYGKEMLRIMSLPSTNRLYSKVPSVPQGTTLINKTGSTAMCCGDMGILVAKGRDGASYPYMVIGIIEAGKRSNSYGTWITNRANVIRGVSNIVYLEMKKHHPL